MTIKEGIKHKGRPYDIPDCTRLDLPNFLAETGRKVGVEVGTSKGEYAKALCEAGLKLYSVDSWKSYDDYYPGEAGQRNLDKKYEFSKKLLAPYDCTIIRKTSMEAVEDFENESLDFVYIDGNHEFKYIAEDLCEWTKKVKKGGVIAGHDYFYAQERVTDNIHTKYIVNAYVEAYKIKRWYVLGRKDKVEGEKRDNFRSFMWIK